MRGTTRDESRLDDIEASGAQAALADPDRLATLMPQLDGVSVLCWLMGSAAGERDAVAALHGPRPESLLETLVDTHVRGLVYEGTGSVAPDLLEQGAALVQRTAETYRMPSAVVDDGEWLDAMISAVERVLSS